jgi:hypothetical protein
LRRSRASSANKCLGRHLALAYTVKFLAKKLDIKKLMLRFIAVWFSRLFAPANPS